ncbi:MAG: type II toxin-antitoxin system Phd/YefM family antitoxin [Actinobacteria bacterium]|nr:type II toxin-antitoxin system Phd/YefM family antitoxin [Actinomycetota bacterium]
MAITAREAQKRLVSLIEQVNDDRIPVEIISRHGNAVLLSRADYEALEGAANLSRLQRNR